MYKCKHCGWEYMTDEAVMCPRCQAPKGKGENFCPFCGTQVTPGSHICTNCGVDMDSFGQVGVKSKIAAGLLGIFLGNLGVHNFYLGYVKKGVIQLIINICAYIFYFIGLVEFVASVDSYYMPDSAAIGFLLSLVVFIVLIAGVRIWSFVEAILILCGKINRDGKGRTLK